MWSTGLLGSTKLLRKTEKLKAKNILDEFFKAVKHHFDTRPTLGDQGR